MEGKKPSRYMQRKFDSEFSEPLEFWTGEDGMLMSLVVARKPDALRMLSEHHVFHGEEFDPSRAKERFVYRDTPEEPQDWPGMRAVWKCTDDPTPFPVLEYELRVPR